LIFANCQGVDSTGNGTFVTLAAPNLPLLPAEQRLLVYELHLRKECANAQVIDLV